MADGSARWLGIEMVSVCTRVDMFFPVEVAHRDHGSLAGLRVEFVDDVAELDGDWRTLDTIALISGKCLVLDPFHLPDGAYWPEISPSRACCGRGVRLQPRVLGVRVVFMP
jgi:hypothetical protein